MHVQTYTISDTTTHFYFDAQLELLQQLAPVHSTFIITDEHILSHHGNKLEQWPVISIPPGEASKNLSVVEYIVDRLMTLDAGRDATIVGIGGGCVTDIAGFVAAIYKRGVKCGLVPTSILAMVDAALGGKSGVDTGNYKNMIGAIRQPSYILYDYSLLESLPEAEWINGFAEIIKHACILDENMFSYLQRHFMEDFRRDPVLLAALVEQNVTLKMTVVEKDELETGIRKWLNFGHTLGHAIENVYELPHGHAVSIGMVFAAGLSASMLGFDRAKDIEQLLHKYHLPAHFEFDPEIALHHMQQDKKRTGNAISFVLLERIGAAIVKPLPVSEIAQYLHS